MPLGWRFGFEIDHSTAVADPQLGLATLPSGGPKTVTGDALIRQAVMMLLDTNPGERVMRPDWGCPLRRVLFQPNDGATAGLAIHYVREAIARFQPRVEVVSVDAGAHADEPGLLELVLVYRIRTSGTTQMLSRLVQLDGTMA